MSDENFAASLMKFIGKYDLNVKVVHRKGSYVIYLKEGEQIVTALSLIGAHAALCELENIRIQKDIRNNVNRMVNAIQRQPAKRRWTHDPAGGSDRVYPRPLLALKTCRRCCARWRSCGSITVRYRFRNWVKC